MSKEAMQMALEALDSDNPDIQLRAAIALRQALVEPKQKSDPSAWHGWVLREVLFDNGEPIGHRKPEQEPVAWFSTSPDGKLSNKFACKPTEGNWVEPLYAAPPKQWVGLTDHEIQDLSYLSQRIDEGNSPWFDRLGFARAVESKLREKNQ
jgi:hypothetical protein